MKLNLRAIPLLMVAIFTLISGVWGGLLRIGWDLPFIKSQIISFHGPLMVCGFLGTLICLERAVAINKPWAYISPILTALGSLNLLLFDNFQLSQYLIISGSLLLFGIFLFIIRLEKTINIFVMLLGVLFWITGNFLWLLGYSISEIVFWWMAFLLFTITGERLELSRLGNLSSKSKKLFVLCSLISIIGLLTTIAYLDIGIRIFGLGILAFTFWLTKFDIARRTIKNKGLTRFIAICLLSGYFWLGVNGLIAVYSGASFIENYYDSFLHSFFLGFIFSMIFGHAPVIFPAVLKVQMNYSSRFYIHLLLLHLSLFLRVLAGLFGLAYLLKISTMLNALVLLFFIVNTITSIKIFKKQNLNIN
jgi:hypothetical protein